MPSLLTLNYFKSFPSFPIVDLEQVNICWENYLTFYLFDICFNVTTGGRQDLTISNATSSVIFHTHSVRCNIRKPSITQKICSRNTGMFVQMQPSILGTQK